MEVGSPRSYLTSTGRHTFSGAHSPNERRSIMVTEKIPAKLTVIGGKKGEDIMEPELEVPTPPDWLEDDAIDEWFRVAEILVDHGLLTTLDLPQLEVYCVSYARWKQNEQELTRLGGTVMEITKKDGEPYYQIRPEVSASKLYYGKMKTAADALGLTPAARAKVAPNAGKKKSKMGGLLD
jgi:P27 family predicted phage terminase small subunit